VGGRLGAGIWGFFSSGMGKRAHSQTFFHAWATSSSFLIVECFSSCGSVFSHGFHGDLNTVSGIAILLF
jgi:hypothetical protein